MREAAGVWKKI